MITIKSCNFLEIADNSNFAILLKEYEESGEAAIEGLPLNIDIEHYVRLEQAGILHSIGAFAEDSLIGFVLLQSSAFPHHCVKITVSDAIYVGKQHRESGAGLELIEKAEEYAKSIGSSGVIFSAPIDGALDKILPKKKYKGIRKLYFKSFAQ